MRTVLLAVIAALLPLELVAAPPVQSPVANLKVAEAGDAGPWLVAVMTLGVVAGIDYLSGGVVSQPLIVLARNAIRGPGAVVSRTASVTARLVARDSTRDTAVHAAVIDAAAPAVAAPAAVAPGAAVVPAAPCAETLTFCRWIEAELSVMVGDVQRYMTQAQMYYQMQREFVRMQTGM